jgi:hypothetical protein
MYKSTSVHTFLSIVACALFWSCEHEEENIYTPRGREKEMDAVLLAQPS